MEGSISNIIKIYKYCHNHGVSSVSPSVTYKTIEILKYLYVFIMWTYDRMYCCWVLVTTLEAAVLVAKAPGDGTFHDRYTSEL